MVDRTYFSPLLNPDDLFFVLQSSFKLDLQSPDDLRKPRPEHIRRLFLALIDLCYGNSKSTPKSSVSKPGRANGDLSEELKSALGLYGKLAELLRKLGSQFKLELRDVTNPTEDRTRSIMSELVNFLKFRTEEELLLAEIQEMQNAAEAGEEIDSLRHKVSKLNLDISEIKGKQQDYVLAVSSKKHQIQELQRDRGQMEEERITIETEIQALEAKLSVQTDPQDDAFYARLAERKSKQIQLQNLFQNLETAVKEMMEVKNAFEQYQNKAKETQKMLSSIQEKASALHSIDTETREIERKLDRFRLETAPGFESEAEISCLKASIQAKEAEISALEEHRDSIRLDHETALRTIAERQEELIYFAETYKLKVAALTGPSLSEMYA